MSQRTNRRVTYKKGLWKRREQAKGGGSKPNRRNAPGKPKKARQAQDDPWAPQIGKHCHPKCGCTAAQKKWGRVRALT